MRPEDNAFDLDSALSRLEGDKELLKEIAGIFIEDCPKLLSEIKKAIESKNGMELEQAAHSLKGSVGNFGAEQAFKAALNLETIGKTNNLEKAQNGFEILDNAIKKLMCALSALDSEESAKQIIDN